MYFCGRSYPSPLCFLFCSPFCSFLFLPSSPRSVWERFREGQENEREQKGFSLLIRYVMFNKGSRTFSFFICLAKALLFFSPGVLFLCVYLVSSLHTRVSFTVVLFFSYVSVRRTYHSDLYLPLGFIPPCYSPQFLDV